jgi:hypothetical protein
VNLQCGVVCTRGRCVAAESEPDIIMLQQECIFAKCYVIQCAAAHVQDC